ncbi:hypothetical protein [Pseudoflavonifractor sp. MSJ-30]|uniref:hypothetical protein n=1 Tax=Pseudoflavonifractor sp. MSJ-30 TaxID=2841525 RepID=UPI001C118E2A|nr:hypothetical protein [Pseudoflavonifractor sp. MSJ-30]
MQVSSEISFFILINSFFHRFLNHSIQYLFDRLQYPRIPQLIEEIVFYISHIIRNVNIRFGVDGVDATDKEQSYKKEYNRVCAYAQAMGKKKAYAIVAGWFVEQFPKYRTEPFYYFNNHPTLIPFQPSNNKENSESELAATGTEG